MDSDNEREEVGFAEESSSKDVDDTRESGLHDSDDEGSEDAPVKKRKRARNDLFDEEAEESGAEGGSDDDDEGGDDYEKDGMVVSDEDDDESRRRGPRRQKMQLTRLKKLKQPQLDEEDIELVKENLGIVDEEQFEPERIKEPEKITASSAADLANRLFDVDEDDVPAAAARSRVLDQLDDDYDSEGMDDFIEDDLDDGAAGPAPGPRPRARVRGELQQEINDALEIFGDGAIDFFGFGEDAGIVDPDAAVDGQQHTAARGAVRATFEPAELIANFCTVADDTIRSTDRPERFQVRLIGRGQIEDAERHEEAVWILEKLAEKRANSKAMGGASAQAPWASSAGGATSAQNGGGSGGWGGADQGNAWGSSAQASSGGGWNTGSNQASGWASAAPSSGGWASTTDNTTGGWTNAQPPGAESNSGGGGGGGGWGSAAPSSTSDAATSWDSGATPATATATAATTTTGGWGGQPATSAGGWGTNDTAAPADDTVGTTEAPAITELEAVIKVLEFIQNDQFEIPFIWTYRRDYLAPKMTCADLWEIYDLDEKWEALQRDRHGLLEKFSRIERLCAGVEDDRPDGDELAAKQAQLDELQTELDATRRLAVYTDGREEEEVQQAEARIEELEPQIAALQSEIEDYTRATQSQAQWEGDGSRSTRQLELAQLLNPAMYAEQLRGMTDELKFSDLKEYMSLVLYAAENKARRTRRVQRLDRELYRRIRKKGLREFTNQFTISASALAEAVDHNKMQQEPPTPSQYPDMLAMEYTDTTEFQTSEQVLAAARHMLALELANEPTLKAQGRAYFNKKATLSTTPTPKGLEEITPLHELFGLHYLDRKPVQDFFYDDDRTLYAKLRKAQQDGFLNITLNAPAIRQDRLDSSTGEIVDHWAPDIEGLREKFEQFYQPSTPETSADDPDVRHSWDEERRKILDDAIVKHMFPALKAELHRRLAQKARETIIEEATANFQKLLSVGRCYKPTITRHELLTANTDISLLPSVVVVYVGDEANNATYLVHLTSRGVVTAHHIIPRTTRDRRKNELRDFLKSARPDAIVVNTSWQGRSMFHLLNHEVISEVRAELERDVRAQQEQGHFSLNLDEDELEAVRNYNPQVLIAKDEVAALVSVTQNARQAFPDFADDMRTAIYLGRYAQEPLNVICALWAHADPTGAFGRDLLFLNLHPLQAVVKNDSHLLRRLEERLIDAVNAAGVDLNAAVTYDHVAPTLAFVSGLGPRKAHALKQKITVQGGTMKSRVELLERKLLNTNVYTNAAGFLRVQALDPDHAEGYDPFDATRIHPECYITYEWAQKICADALEDSYSGSNYSDIVEQLRRNVSRVLAKTLRDKPDWHPDTAGLDDELKDKVYDLDLDAYAGVLEEQGAGKRRLQLLQIKMELRFPFLDRRQPFMNPTPEEQFTLFTGEDDTTIFKGLKVYATVQNLQPRKANVRLEGGLRGFIPIRLVEDSMTHDISAVLREGQVVQCVVQRVFKDTINVELSCRPSDLKVPEEEWLQELERKFDPKFRRDIALEEYHKMLKNKEAQAQRAADAGAARMDIAGQEGKQVQKMYTRQSFHPAFKNCRADHAEQELRGQGAGEVIFRPSSRGPDILVITWAFQEGCFKHIDVKEHDKLNPVQIGRRLELDGESYEGLDEIMARYISPMNDFVEMMTADRKFFNGTRAQVEAQLKEEKAADKTRIPYYVWIDPGKPGYFVISFVRNVSVQHMLAAVTPAGYRLDNRIAESPSQLIRIFKEVASRTTSSQPTAPQGRLRTTSRWSNVTAAPGQPAAAPPAPTQPPMASGWGAPSAGAWGAGGGGGASGGTGWGAPAPTHAGNTSGWGR